ncbi:MAG: efflux RND transporter permease subunit [Gemmataceae bacterium]|nr:efflux RND transporter permease subunit [Gemmataceae bacterium]MDW8265770.1 efflux RND transporter permease subunit [Gemmataceae bacterium]
MTLSDVSIRNPVFPVMLSAGMVIFGYLGYRDLGVSQFPEIDFPVVNITTYWEAASPETIDHDVTDVIEDAVAGVEGIDYIQSQSLEGVSVVTVYFHLDRDIDVAMQDVQNAVSAAARNLPTGVDPPIDPPIVSKVNYNKYPVIWLSIYGRQPMAEVSRFVDEHFKQHLESIPGCGGFIYGGLRRRSMRIWLDGDRLHAHQLDAVDVVQALRREHVEKPAGYLQGERRELNVRTLGEARTAAEFAAMPIAGRGAALVRLGDVAVVEDGLEDYRGFARFNRQPNIGIGVLRANGANIVQLCDEVKRRLPELRRLLPPGMEIGIGSDYSLFIKDDIEEVKQSLLLGILLTALVTFVFLGSLGTTLNVCVSIPTSLIGTFMVMRYFGFTLNFMTLLALSLAVGVVVDDAILVLENIYRRREHGEGRVDAAQRGAREISFAALAATLSVVAIFVPVAFMKGAIGRFFLQFGISVAFAVLLSLVISLTVTPMLCSVFLQVRPRGRPCPRPYRGWLGPAATLVTRLHWLVDRWLLEPCLLNPLDRFLAWLGRAYERVLRLALRHPAVVISTSSLLAASAYIFAFGLDVPVPDAVAGVVGRPKLSVKPVGRELVPSEDQNRFVVQVICPVGSSIDYVDRMLQRGEDILIGLRDPTTGRDLVAGLFTAISIRPGALISEGILFVRLIPLHERSVTQAQVMTMARQKFAQVPGMRAIVLDLSTQGFTAARGYPVDFAVQGPDWRKTIVLAERVRQRMIDSGVVTDVNTDYRPGMPEVQVVPDPVKAAEVGVSIQRIALTLNAAFGGVRAGRFTDEGRRYDVRVRFLEGQRSSPDQLEKVCVKTEKGALVPLRDVVRWETVSTLPVINRYNHARKIELTANVVPGVSQGEAISRCLELAQAVREEMGLPPSYHFVQLGNAQAMQDVLASLTWALALGFVVAWMILGVQFNSFVHPLTVLVAVPFGVTGALATLWLTGDTLNMMSMIGLVLLAGLVKKNSIILVDYANQLRAEGQGSRQAVLAACPVRLRPILMTSLATIAAAVPLAFGYGPGAETRAPLARSIIGGIFLSTLVTLVLVPVLYVLLDRFADWLRGLTGRPEPTLPSRHRGPKVPPRPAGAAGPRDEAFVAAPT